MLSLQFENYLYHLFLISLFVFDLYQLWFTLYTGQNQNPTQPINQPVVPNRRSCAIQLMTLHVTMSCQIVASDGCDYNHRLRFLHNQINHHQNHFAYTQIGTNQVFQMQNRKGCCPMLPPIEPDQNPVHLQQQNVLMDYYSHQMYLPPPQVTAPFNQPTYKGVETTYQGKSKNQPPVKSFISWKTSVEKG